MKFLRITSWSHLQELEAKSYKCGYCSDKVSAHKGYRYVLNRDDHGASYVCPNCGYPTFFYDHHVYPSPKEGREIQYLPADIEEIYNEIREGIKNELYTSSILLGRKLLMHLSVDIAGSDASNNFKAHINHLQQSGYVPPNGMKLLEFIREIGNQQNHEIVVGEKNEALKMLKFIEMLLLFMYELPNQFEEK